MARLAVLRTWLGSIDEKIAALALGLMMLIPLIEIGMRPLLGSGIANAPVVVQHLGLVLAMFASRARRLRGGWLSYWRLWCAACWRMLVGNSSAQSGMRRIP